MKEEVERLIAAAEEADLKALIMLSYLFGFRISETLSLKKDDFSVRDGYLYVYIKPRKRPDLVGSSDKFPNKIALSAPFMDFVLKYLDAVNAGEPLFRFSNASEKCNIRIAQMELKKLSQKTGIIVWSHLFRRTRATKFAERGATESQLRAWFHWKKPETAARYVELSGVMIDKLSDKVD